MVEYYQYLIINEVEILSNWQHQCKSAWVDRLFMEELCGGNISIDTNSSTNAHCCRIESAFESTKYSLIHKIQSDRITNTNTL